MIILGESVNNGDLVLCAFAWNFFVVKESIKKLSSAVKIDY